VRACERTHVGLRLPVRAVSHGSRRGAGSNAGSDGDDRVFQASGNACYDIERYASRDTVRDVNDEQSKPDASRDVDEAKPDSSGYIPDNSGGDPSVDVDDGEAAPDASGDCPCGR